MTFYVTKDRAGGKITNLAVPTENQNIVTKAYVDAIDTRINAMELMLQIDTGTNVSDMLAAGKTTSCIVHLADSAKFKLHNN